MVEVVVWDIGMVLVEWHPERFYDRTIGEERRRALFAETEPHEMNKSIDLGTHSRDAAYGHAEKHPDWADELRRWHDDWIEMLAPAIEGSAHLLRALRARGVRCVALTNFGANTIEIAQEVYPQLREFEEMFVSGRLKMVKPDPRIYAEVEQATGVGGAALLFADDSAANIAAAKARGWKTHHFDGPEGWGQRLVAEGLLVPEDLPG